MTEPTTELAIFEPIQAQMAEYKAENEKLVFDYNDPQGNKDARSHVYKLRLVKGRITAAHKEAKAEALAWGRKCDGMKNQLMSELEGMIRVHNGPLLLIEREKAEKEAEKQRKIQEAQEKAAAEREAELKAREEAVRKAEDKAAAEIAAEEAKKGAQREEAERAEREKRIAEEAKAKAEAEHKAALEAAERKRLADIAAAKEFERRKAKDKELAERRRQEAEAAAKRKAEEKERERQENKRHQAKIHVEIYNRILELVTIDEISSDKNIAEEILGALKAGTIPHVKITY